LAHPLKKKKLFGKERTLIDIDDSEKRQKSQRNTNTFLVRKKKRKLEPPPPSKKKVMGGGETEELEQPLVYECERQQRKYTNYVGKKSRGGTHDWERREQESAQATYNRKRKKLVTHFSRFLGE